MLSVTQSAEVLKVSPARVRAMIKSGVLPAEKAGKTWCLHEEDVFQRLSDHRGPGRPRKDRPAVRAAEDSGWGEAASAESCQAHCHQLYLGCKERFGTLPSSDLLSVAQSQEEASFYMAVFDFFLQQKQAQLVAEGAY